jgi:NADPH-dependent 2,4-dienoyl-CoA reductase/sulfur reductase-like enzyme
MEVASLLVEATPESFNISVVELLDRPLPLMLDGDMAESLTTYLQEKGLTLLTGE